MHMGYIMIRTRNLHGIISLGQPIRCGPPVGELGEGLKISHGKKHLDMRRYTWPLVLWKGLGNEK